MAGSGRMNTGTLPRQLQLGVDNTIKHDKNNYLGVASQVFKVIANHPKAYYEQVQLAGMGLAGVKGQGEPIISYDSVDQDWVYRQQLITYEKSARVTMEAIRFNLYEDLIPLISKEIKKGVDYRMDWDCADILNNAFTTTGPDGKVLCATDHPVANTTVSNTVSADFDEDALEQLVILIHKFKNPDGLESMYEPMNLVYPIDLEFEVKRVLGSQYRPASADNDINALAAYGSIKNSIVWKRLTDTDAFFVTTNAENGLKLVKNMDLDIESWNDPNGSRDIIISGVTIYRALFDDFRGIAGSPGV